MKPVLLSDIGKVLLSVQREKMLDPLAQRLASSREEIRRYLYDQEFHRDLELGYISPENFIRQMLQVLDTDVSISVEELSEIMGGSFALNKDLFRIIDRFRPEFRVILLSNTNDFDIQAIEDRFGLLNWADGAILSHKVHLRKPDPEIYKYAISEFDLIPAETIFIDDLFENVEAAKKLGFQAEVYESPDQVENLLSGILLKTTNGGNL